MDTGAAAAGQLTSAEGKRPAEEQGSPEDDDDNEDYADDDEEEDEAAVGGGGSAAAAAAADEDVAGIMSREMDRFLPIANISRIMKKALPNNAKIAKDAKETEQECVSEFISFITSEASERCSQEKRKTINGDDIIHAMTQLGFTEYISSLQVYLAKYREAAKEGSVGGANKATRKRPAGELY